MIRTSLYGASVIVIEAIVGVGSPQRRKGKTVTKFDALYGGNGEHHMADLAFKGVEKRVSQTGGQTENLAFDDTAYGIEVSFGI